MRSGKLRRIIRAAGIHDYYLISVLAATFSMAVKQLSSVLALFKVGMTTETFNGDISSTDRRFH